MCLFDDVNMDTHVVGSHVVPERKYFAPFVHLTNYMAFIPSSLMSMQGRSQGRIARGSFSLLLGIYNGHQFPLVSVN